MTTAGIDPKLEARITRLESAQAGDTSALAPVRRAALQRFLELGFPTTKMEAWRGTDVAPIARTTFEPAPHATLSPAELEALVGPALGARAVFVNGWYAAELSCAQPGAIAKNPLLARVADGQDDAFTALNTASFDDGFEFVAPAGTVITEPLEIVHVTCGAQAPFEVHPRVLVVAQPGSRMHLIETFAGRGDAASFTNAVTEIVVAAGARVDHTRIQREAAGASHIASVYATLDRDAQFTARSFALGARLARTETRVVFTAPGGTAVLDGLYLLDGAQHSDNRTSVDHAQPHCTSRQNYKGVLAGASRGVFQGRVVVRPDAQHTDAQQSNRNLILSESALVDTQPQLEILADDVRCTHGATIGRLDDDARFYLQSRGIAAADAERLLTQGFAHEIIDATTPVELRERIAALVDARFAARSEVGGAP